MLHECRHLMSLLWQQTHRWLWHCKPTLSTLFITTVMIAFAFLRLWHCACTSLRLWYWTFNQNWVKFDTALPQVISNKCAKCEADQKNGSHVAQVTDRQTDRHIKTERQFALDRISLTIVAGALGRYRQTDNVLPCSNKYWLTSGGW